MAALTDPDSLFPFTSDFNTYSTNNEGKRRASEPNLAVSCLSPDSLTPSYKNDEEKRCKGSDS